MNKKDTEQQRKAQQSSDTPEHGTLWKKEYQIVGDHIKDLMNSVNWSPAELCKWADVDSGNLSKALKGEKGVTGYTLLMIQQAVQKEQRERRQRASFRDEKSEAVRRKVIPQMDDMMTRDGLSSDKVDGICESVAGIIKSAYAP